MFETLLERLTKAFTDFLDSVVAWTPRIAVALVLLIVAIIAAKIAERITRTLVRRLKFDAVLGKVGLDQVLQRMGIRASLDRVIPRIVYFLLLILFARTASDALGLGAISAAMGAFFAYLPNLIAAVLILVVGSAAAQFVGRAVSGAAQNAGIEFADSLGSLVSGLVLFVLGIMAIGQLQLDTEIVRLVSTCVLAGFALAFGLSFGLGTKDITRNILAGFYARKVFKVGEEIEVRGERGTLRSITPTQVLFEQEGQVIAVSNSVFLDEVVKK